MICLIGQKRVGKDTVANIIQSWDSEYERFALADPIKDIARIMFNFSESQLFDADKDVLDDSWGIRPRDFFERFGTDIMQFDIYKYIPGLKTTVPSRCFWVQSLINKIKKQQYQKVIITDIRGLHELNSIREAFPKALFIKITRDSTSDSTAAREHITQLEPELIPLDKIDVVIDNSGTLEELREKVKKMIYLQIQT
jgi:dephospho-CoA kinase